MPFYFVGLLPILQFVNLSCGEVGVVKETLKPEGRVFIHGETWNAASDTVISDGEKVIVEAVKDLKIKVRKVDE